MARDRMQFKIEDAKIFWLNFAGRAGRFSQEGEKKRSFCVALPEDMAKQMEKDGWNVKFPGDVDSEEEDSKDIFINVAVKYKIRPPKIVLITSGGTTYLTEDMVEILDGMEFSQVDLIAVASNWEMGGKSGIKAYLKTMYLTVDEDDLDRKYAHVGRED